MSETDAALAARARGGDRAAFEELVRRTSRLVYARLYLDVGRPERVEDLMQETYLLAFRSLRSLANPAGFRAWLLSIAQRVLIDDGRRAARQKRAAPAADTDVMLVPTHQPPPDAVAELAELREQVMAALRALPPGYRLPLTLRYIVGADYASIGEQLGMTNGALRGVLHRGMNLLRDLLPPDFAAGFLGRETN